MGQEEHKIQRALFKKWELQARSDERYAAIFAVPNSSRRGAREGARLKAEGMRAGIPDIIVPIPIPKWGILFIEQKRGADPRTGKAKGRLSAVQKEWISLLQALGNTVAVSYSFEETEKLVGDWMKLHEMEAKHG